jgi:hypothetical protein
MTLAACSAVALLLSACESTGSSRFAGVGAGNPGSGSGSGGGSGGGTDGGAGGGSGGSGGGTGGGTGGTGGGTGSGSGSGPGNVVTAALEQVSPVLVTAGNAVLGVSDGQGGLTTPIATALPVAQPVTGTITRILNDTGTVLVDAGEGRTLLLQGAQGVVGDLVTIDVGGRNVTNGLNGTAGAIGVGVLGGTQPVGTVASVGVLNAGNTALATVNGLANVSVTNVTAPTGGVANNLLNVALGGNQLLGTGDPALVNASLLPGGLALPGTGSGGLPATGPVTGTVGAVVQSATGLLGGTGATGALGSTVQQVTGSVLAPIGVSAGATTGGAQAGAGATASPGGLLAPVTGAVGGVVGGLTGGLTGGLSLNQ